MRDEEIPGGEVGGGKLSVSLNTDTVRHTLAPQGTATSVETLWAVEIMILRRDEQRAVQRGAIHGGPALAANWLRWRHNT